MVSLGIDVGTQGTKALLIDEEKRTVLGRASSSYELIAGLPEGHAEQHPQTWLDALSRVVHELVERTGVDARSISCVGVSGQQHGFVALDSNDEVIRPAKLWCDTATSKEADELSRRYGRRVPTGFTASKILWMSRNEPENFSRLRSVLLPHDYVNFWLTGNKSMECGDASGTGFFDPRARRFSIEEMRAIDRALPDMIPPLLEAGESAGLLSARAAKILHLEEGIPVASGGGDNMMSAIGSGAFETGVVVISLGTSGTVFTFSDQPVVDPEGLIAPFCDSTGGWLPLLCVMNLTGVTEEVRRCFGMELEEITALATRVSPGCDGLSFLPYLQGERVPDLPLASGTLSGIRPGSLSAGHLFRAALEGTSFNLELGVERMKRLGIPLDSVRLVGGAARNPLWRRILADVLGVTVQKMLETESAALGAALQAAWTRSLLERPTNDPAQRRLRLSEIARPFLQTEGDPTPPNPETSPSLAGKRRQFRELLKTLHGVH